MTSLRTITPGVEFRLTSHPLLTEVQLDDRAKREFTLLFALRQMEDKMWEISHDLDNGDYAGARDEVSRFTSSSMHDGEHTSNYNYWERYSNLHHVNYYLDAIVNDPHEGDCTAIACSCVRCHAEQILDVDTTRGLGKRALRMVPGILERFPDGYKDCDPILKAAYEFAIEHKTSFLAQST